MNESVNSEERVIKIKDITHSPKANNPNTSIINRNSNLTLSSPNRSNNSEIESRKNYYKTIVKKGNFATSFLKPPPHFLNPNLFYISPIFSSEDGKVDEVKGEPAKAKSWMTIISIWNTMIGSTLVSLPWSVRRAGIIPTIGKVLDSKIIFILIYN